MNVQLRLHPRPVSNTVQLERELRVPNDDLPAVGGTTYRVDNDVVLKHKESWTWSLSGFVNLWN